MGSFGLIEILNTCIPSLINFLFSCFAYTLSWHLLCILIYLIFLYFAYLSTNTCISFVIWISPTLFLCRFCKILTFMEVLLLTTKAKYEPLCKWSTSTRVLLVKGSGWLLNVHWIFKLCLQQRKKQMIHWILVAGVLTLAFLRFLALLAHLRRLMKFYSLIWQGLRARTKKHKYSFSTSSLQSGLVHLQSDDLPPLIWIVGYGQYPAYWWFPPLTTIGVQ